MTVKIDYDYSIPMGNCYAVYRDGKKLAVFKEDIKAVDYCQHRAEFNLNWEFNWKIKLEYIPDIGF